VLRGSPYPGPFNPGGHAVTDVVVTLPSGPPVWQRLCWWPLTEYPSLYFHKGMRRVVPVRAASAFSSFLFFIFPSPLPPLGFSGRIKSCGALRQGLGALGVMP
jgi:hypothetical protein